MRNNADFEARQARSEGSMGVAKTCTVCGQTGHNRRTCPLVTGSQVCCISSAMPCITQLASTGSRDFVVVLLTNTERSGCSRLLRPGQDGCLQA